MSRITETFSRGKAFIPFITAGDPCIEITEQLIYAMENAGADIIEIGIPFSDPIAEGIVIQKAHERALAAETTLDKIFDMVERVRYKTDIPLVFMTYLNPVYVYGKKRFVKQASRIGIDGLIVPDTPFEESSELSSICKKYNIDLISMIAPTSKQRISAIAAQAQGFMYCVSSLGVTGMRSEFTADIKGMISLVKEVKPIPCAVGFGISTPAQAKKISSFADGVIVGSAIVKIVQENGIECLTPVSNYVHDMKAAII